MRTCALTAALILAPLGQMATAQPVQVTGGALAGASEDGVTVFKGIPYAAAPVGENRWRAPQPAPGWAGVRAATSFGHDCAQAPFPPDAAPIETTPAEDCLYLNVWKPVTAAPGAGLPVMVWIHGGGFVNGGTSPGVYAGASFARDGVVFVSLNYRLGRFGFFAHPGLAAEGFGGNFGFLDQIAALKWVQANIAAFGGDPAHVTVFGESAGGMSVHMLLQSPLARGLFAQAIVESGGGRAGTLPMPTLAAAAQAGATFAPGLNAAQLRALPEARVTGDLSMMTMGKAGYSGPIVDGRTILGSALEAASAGIDARVPVIIGTNSADGFPFVTDKAKIFAGFGADEAQARTIYDATGSTPGIVVAAATSADRMMIEPARAVVRVLAAQQPVWVYRFAYGVGPFASALGGAPHASEIPYVMDRLAARKVQPMIAAEQPVATLTHRYWVNFAKYGRPDGSADVPAWKAAVPGDTTVQIIDADGARHAEDPFAARLDFNAHRAGAN